MIEKIKKGVISIELPQEKFDELLELVNEEDIPFATIVSLYKTAENEGSISSAQYIASICALKNMFASDEWQVGHDEKGIYKLQVKQ